MQELPKAEKDQKPIHSNAEDTWTKFIPTGYLSSILTSERTRAVTEFVIRYGNEYLKSASDKRQQEEEFKRFEAEYKEERRKRRPNRNSTTGSWFGAFNKQAESSSSSEDEDERNKLKQKMKEKQKQEKNRKTTNVTKEESQVLAPSSNTLAKSAAAASVLSLSLYSTYQATVTFNEVSFHNQLEILISQVQSIVQSTEVWIEEHDKMDDEIPNQVRNDLVQLKQLIDLLVRLDPRANKKIEAVGWSCGAVGGLSALGGVALGSATALTGGAALVIGGAIVMISSKASGKSQLGARLLLENQVREKVAACQNSASERERIMEEELGPKTKKEKERVTPSKANSMNSVKKDVKQEKESNTKTNRKRDKKATQVLEAA